MQKNKWLFLLVVFIGIVVWTILYRGNFASSLVSNDSQNGNATWTDSVVQGPSNTQEASNIIVQNPSWSPCDGLFNLSGNQGNSTFIDTTAAAAVSSGTYELVKNGYEIRGCVRSIGGNYAGWAPFEGILGQYYFKDLSGNVITSWVLEAYPVNWGDLLQALQNWENIFFRKTVNYDFSSLSGQLGELEIRNTNPSWESQNSRFTTTQVIFGD